MSTNRFRRFTKSIFVFANIATALLFLLGCYNAMFNPQKFWFLGLLNLGAIYLLVVLVGFIVFWLFAKKRLILISIIAILLALKPIGHLIEFRFSPNFIAAKHPSNLRVMSWNVEHFDILEHKTHPEHKQQMIDLINEYKPDIACFQEMVGSDKVPSAINYVPDFAAKLNMPFNHYAYNSKLDFDGNHHFGIIIFSKYPIISKNTMSYEPNDYNSIFEYVDIARESDTIRIFNIHLQSLKFSSGNLQYINEPGLESGKDLKNSKNLLSKFKTGFVKRAVQSDRIQKAISESPYPVVVCGDFNDVPNSYAYTTIGKNLRNAFAEKGTGIGRTFYGISPTLRIDNIFTDKRFDIEQFVRVKKKLSDHFPIVADLFLPKP